MNRIIITASLITAIVLVLFLSSCSWTAYNKTKYGYDEVRDELYVIEEIHAGRLALASDIDLSDLELESGDKRLVVDKAKENQDSLDVEVDPITRKIKAKTGE